MKTVLWDWNGTLLDDLDLSFECLNDNLRRFGKPTLNHVDDYRRIFTFPVKEYYARAGLGDDLFERAAPCWMADYMAREHVCLLRQGAREALEAFPALGMEVHRGADVRVCRRNAGVEEHLRRMGAPVLEADMDQILFPWTKVVLVGEKLHMGDQALSHRVTDWFRERFPDKYEAVPAGALVDIVSAGNDKGTGVRRLASLLDIAPGKVVCVGDSWNDLPMLRAAGRAFAPANALEAVRAEPGVVTVGDSRSCLRDVVEALRKP